MSTGDLTPALDYAPAPRIARRRIRMVAIALVIFACAYAGWRWGPAWRDRANLLYAQRKVMNYDPPADQIVMSNIAEDVASLPGVVSGYKWEHRFPRVSVTRKARDQAWKHEEFKPLDFVWYVDLLGIGSPPGAGNPVLRSSMVSFPHLASGNSWCWSLACWATIS